MLAGSDEHACGSGLFKVLVSPVIVGTERFFDPFEIMLRRGVRKARCIVEIERHPAVEHEPEIRAYAPAHFPDVVDRLSHAFVAFDRGVAKRHLAPNESHLLGQVRPGSRGIKLDFIAHGAANHRMDRLLPQSAEEVPQGQIDTRDGVYNQPFATIILGGKIHLVPDQFDIGWILTDDEAGQMLLHNVCGGLSAGRDGKADRSVIGLNFHDQCAEGVDAKAAAAFPVIRIFGHWGGDIVIDPVPV